MAALIETNQVGKREDLRDLITIVDAKNKPFLAMVPKIKKMGNMLMEWQADDYDSLDLSGVPDGKDVETFENAAKDRAVVQNYGQKWRRTAMVGDLAENVSNVAGASSGDMARSIDKKFEEISRDIEATLCSTNSAVAGTSSVAYKTRGLGQWIHTTYSGVDDTQVPSVARPPTASVDAATATTDIMLESEFRTVCRSVFQEYGKRDNLVFLAGTVMKQQFSDFTQTTSTVASATSVRAFTAPISNKISRNVTIYEGDFNDIEVHTSLLLAASTGSSAGNTDYGYLLPLEKYGLAFNRAPRVRRLEDQGGGPRAYIDAVAGLVSWSPRSSGKIILK